MRGRSAGLVSALVALAVALAAVPTVAQTAVPLWRQTFRPSTSGTISPAPLASRELVDGTVMVVTDDGSVVRYDHDGNVVSSTQLPLGRPVPKSQPSRAGGPDAPDGGGQHPPVAAIDAFGTVAFSRQVLLGFQGSDSNIVTMKFDGITAEPLWQAPAVWDANGQNYPLSVLFDSNANVVMSGVNMASIHVLVEYSASTGETRWGPKLLANVSPPYVKTVIGPYDSVIVSATWGGSGGPDVDILTTAYAGLNGITLWSEDFDSGKDDVVADATLDSFGRVILAGYTGDLTGLRYLVLSYEALGGGLHWQSQPYAGPAGSFSVATSVRADLFNNLFVSGSSSSPGGSPIQYATLKLDGITGQPIWGPQIRDNANSAVAPDLLLTGNGDVIVDALVDDGTLARDFIRYRGSDGEPVSEAPIPSADPAAQIPDAPLVASNGRIFDAAAFASQTVVLEIEGTSAAWGPTPLTDAAVGQGQFNDLFVDGNGDVLALGDRADHTETLVLKYDGHTGAVLWGPISIANAAGMYSYQIVADAANDAFVVANDGNGALELFKLSGANGSQIWSLAYPLPDTYLSPARAAVDTAGHLVVVAQSNGVNGIASAVTLKIDGATNAVLWSKTYQADVNVQAFANTVAIAPSGDVFLVGDTYSTQISQYDWFAIKYAAATGDVVWGPIVFPNGQPFGAASDPSGNLVMTGSRPNGMTTNKYSGADGSFLWSTSVSGVSIAEGRDVIVNASGDVYAAGNIGRETSVVDMAIVKYASADGSVLWGPRYFDGEAHSFDFVYDLGLGFDGSGNVVLGGTTRRPSNYTDLVALKYDAATGATLWGPVYAGGPGDQTMTGFGVHGGLVAAGAPSAGAFLVQAWSEAFGIATPFGSLPPAYCGIELSFTFSAANGTTPYAWSISAGALPAGMTLSSTGILSGTPTEQGLFTFTVHVSDASAASASRDFTLFVQPPPDRAIITSATDPTCQTTLSVLGNDWAALQWLPGGETTPTIVVRPTTATTYGVLATDAEGCVHRGELTVPGYPLVNPECDAPSISSVSPPSGSAAGGVSLTIAGANFDPAAVVHVGGVEATVVSADSGQIVVTTPVLTPGTANDVLVLNPSSANAAMLKAFFADFLDVPDSDPFHDDIALLVKNGITAGCGSGNYCPAASVTRAQMAVFLLKSKYGASHVPPPATGVFNDVPAEDPFAPWIEELASLGVTAGCGNNNYCPAAPVTRAQMAVFLLKTLNGSSYTPPPATGIFGDVPASDPFAPWIEQLYLLQITGGCSTSPLLYCPASSVTRAQMSAFLSRTFALS